MTYKICHKMLLVLNIIKFIFVPCLALQLLNKCFETLDHN